MGWVFKCFDKWRKRALTRGYTCDWCGRELFDYPVHRLCEECEKAFRPPALPCPKCGRNCKAEGVCLDCKSRLPRFTRGISALVYTGDGASVVNRMKNGNPRLAAYLGERMADCFLQAELLQEGEVPLLLPVPLTKERKRERGYNQAERLAESVQNRLRAAGVECTLDSELLIKTRETGLQKRMTRGERAENAAGAYFVHKRKACRGRTILLIDDVMTTGATGNECARVLFGAGAKAVYFLTATALPEPK